MSRRVPEDEPPLPPPRPPLRPKPAAGAAVPPARPATPAPTPQIPEAERIEYVIGLLANGFSRSEILPHIGRRFEVDAAAAQRYLREALSELKRAATHQTSFDGLQQSAMLRSLYRDCLRNQDFRAALETLKLLMRVSGTRLLDRDGDVILTADPDEKRQPLRLPTPGPSRGRRR